MADRLALEDLDVSWMHTLAMPPPGASLTPEHGAIAWGLSSITIALTLTIAAPVLVVVGCLLFLWVRMLSGGTSQLHKA